MNSGNGCCSDEVKRRTGQQPKIREDRKITEATSNAANTLRQKHARRTHTPGVARHSDNQTTRHPHKTLRTQTHVITVHHELHHRRQPHPQ